MNVETLDKRDVFGESFSGDSQADNAAARERLDELGRARPTGGQPLANARHKPGLPAGIAKRAALRHARNVDDLIQ